MRASFLRAFPRSSAPWRPRSLRERFAPGGTGARCRRRRVTEKPSVQTPLACARAGDGFAGMFGSAVELALGRVVGPHDAPARAREDAQGPPGRAQTRELGGSAAFSFGQSFVGEVRKDRFQALSARRAPWIIIGVPSYIA